MMTRAAAGGPGPSASNADPKTPSASETMIAALAGLEDEIERTFPVGSRQHGFVRQPLAAVRAAVDAVATDPEAVEAVTATIDDLEDVLEALMRTAGWPGG